MLAVYAGVNCLAVDWLVRGELDERKRSNKMIFSILNEFDGLYLT